MPRKKKGELPSGNIRKQVYIGKEIVRDEYGNPIIDPETGKPKTRRKYASITADNAKEAEKAKANLKADIANNKYKRNKASITLYKAIEEYIDSREKLGRSPTTIHDYRVILEHAFPDLMGMEMSEFTEEILQAAIDMEATRPCKKKTKNPRPISAKRLKNEWGVVTPVLKKYRPDIDTAAIELPSCQERIVELPAAEKVIEAVRGTDIELPVLLAAWLSFSMSEIRGLRKSKSLSEDGNYISIREVVVDVGGKSVVKSTGKTSTRLRKHRIPDYIKQLIDEVEGDYLVPMSWSKLYKRWMAVQRENGITPITFHDLRHINASVMAILRIPDKYAQERGGWKTDAVMKKIYTQTFAEERVKVDDKMDSYFNDMVYENNEEEFDMQKYNAFLELFGLSDNAEMRKRFNELNGK